MRGLTDARCDVFLTILFFSSVAAVILTIAAVNLYKIEILTMYQGSPEKFRSRMTAEQIA